MFSVLRKIRDFFWLGRKTFMTNYFRIYYSQFGEDIILKEWIPKTQKTGFYVDVGCYHPKKFSNTYMLYKRGWRGINIDLDEVKIKAFNLARPDDINIVAAVSDRKEKVVAYSFSKYGLGSTIDEKYAEETTESIYGKREVYTTTLNEILDSTRYKNHEIDLLSIDVEGHDFEVLKSIDLEVYRPKIMIIESHQSDIQEVMLSETYQYLTERNYYLANWIGYSLLFRMKTG